MDITSLLLSKKYVEDTVAGAGAIKGKSAYEIACENGFKGTPGEWLISLQGATPEIGANGHWTINGIDTGVIASPDLAGYATEEYVGQEIANIPKVDLSNYVTEKDLNEAILGVKIPDISNLTSKEELDAAIKAIVFPQPDLTPYATKDEVTHAINNIPQPDLSIYATKDEIPDITNLANKEYVNQKIAEAKLEKEEVDLSAYATKEELQEVINNIEHPIVDLSGYATKQDVKDEISNIVIPEVDLSNYATKNEIPSLEGLASEEFVSQKIGEIEIPEISLNGYATEEFVSQKIAEAQLGGDKEVDLSAYYTKTEIDTKLKEIEHPTTDLTDYATIKFVEETVENLSIPSIDGLASEEFVEEKISSISIPSVEGLASEQYVDEKFNSIEVPSIEGLASESYVQSAIADLVGAAPETLNTLDELATALKDNADIVDTLTASIGNKADKSEIPSVAGLASEEYVDNAIATIKIPEAKPDINVYEIVSDSIVVDELITLLPEDAEIHSGDVMLVSNSMGVKSAYQFDEEWIACDGNVDASKVIMPFDITLAGSYERVGNLTKTSTGIATFATKGKSVAQALQEILSKREQPKIKTQPSVSLTVINGAKEVGTKITPTWSATLNAGAYTYGPATGITASKWEISDGTNKASTSSGSFPEITVEDNTNYKITAKATYEAGTVAKDNLGDPSDPTIQIAAGSKSATGSAITGYRAWFMYIGESLDELNNAFIRGSSNKGSTPTTQNNIEIPGGTKRVMVAIPTSSTLELKQVIDVDGMGLDVFGNFTKTSINVEGLNNYTAKAYNVWVAENTNGMAATHFNLVIG